MEKITSAKDLKIVIHGLEHKQAYEWTMLKGELLDTFESLKPINLIKGTLNEVYASPDLKANAVNTAIRMATGFIAKKAFVGSTYNPLRKLLGYLIEMVVINKVTKNADGIKLIGGNILKKIINQNHTKGND